MHAVICDLQADCLESGISSGPLRSTVSTFTFLYWESKSDNISPVGRFHRESVPTVSHICTAEWVIWKLVYWPAIDVLSPRNKQQIIHLLRSFLLVPNIAAIHRGTVPISICDSPLLRFIWMMKEALYGVQLIRQCAILRTAIHLWHCVECYCSDFYGMQCNLGHVSHESRRDWGYFGTCSSQ